MTLVKLQKTDSVVPTATPLPSSVSVAILPGKTFNVQANRVTSRVETYLKIKGSFKVRIQNKGDVDIILFGNFPIPSHGDETFETGDTDLGFVADTAIQYAPESLDENINLILTNYFKVNDK